MLGGLWSYFSGKFGYFPWASLSYCLAAAECELCDVDLITIGDDTWARGARETIQDVVPILDKAKVLYIDRPQHACHHFHHALASFHLSANDDAAVLIIDGDGSASPEGYEAETGFVMSRNGGWTQIFKNRYGDRAPPRSGIGWMYEQVSYLLGYGNHEIGLAEPGKTMGLSAYGRPVKELAEPWITADGFQLDFSGFKRWLVETGYDRLVFARDGGLAARFLEPPAMAENLAYKVQAETESAILHLARTLRKETGAAALCIGGGVALNSVANGKLVRERIFDRVDIVPAVHDGGQAIGLAIHGHLLLTTPAFQSGMQTRIQRDARLDPRPVAPLESAYLGREYDDALVYDTLTDCNLPFDVLDDADLIESASAALAAGRIIGWFQGRSEIGPRALGNRSILACPTFSGAKAVLNARVKFREGFRPFAPAVTLESSHEIFDLCVDSPYMLLVADVRPTWADRIPAVVHVDGSARLQTVSRAVNPRFHALIASFASKTGVPVVLNTSFNVAGMPIVESPIDAVRCFVQTQLDELYLGNARVRALGPEASTYAMKAGWTVSSPLAGPDGRLNLSAPDRTAVSIDCRSALLRALALVDGTLSTRDVMRRAGLAGEDYDELDALMKRLVRLGCLELRLGRHRISSARHDST